MYIEKVLEYAYNYAEYIVSDGKKQLRCVCMSVPLQDGQEPQRNMIISKIYAFSACDDVIVIKKVTQNLQNCDRIKKRLFDPLGYELRGRVLDANNSIIGVFGFEIHLTDHYPNGLPVQFANGDYVEFYASRLDCEIENNPDIFRC